MSPIEAMVVDQLHLELKTPIDGEPGSRLLLEVVEAVPSPADQLEQFLQVAKRVKQRIAARGGVTSDSVDIVRELREERSR